MWCSTSFPCRTHWGIAAAWCFLEKLWNLAGELLMPVTTVIQCAEIVELEMGTPAWDSSRNKGIFEWCTSSLGCKVKFYPLNLLLFLVFWIYPIKHLLCQEHQAFLLLTPVTSTHHLSKTTGIHSIWHLCLMTCKVSFWLFLAVGTALSAAVTIREGFNIQLFHNPVVQNNIFTTVEDKVVFEEKEGLS